MSILSWGKPTVEFTKSNDGAPATGATWAQFSDIKENTSKLTPTKGNKTEATVEGGDVVDSRSSKNKYAFECEVFVKKGDTRPIEDEDGVVTDNYAMRLTPEDAATEGFAIDNSTVSVGESWTSADGKMLKYTFDALKPKTGKIVKPYIANGLVVTPTALYFGNTADTAGKAVTVTSTTNPTASSSESWCTIAVAAKVVTVKVTANTGGEARSAVVTVTADGKTSRIPVTQIPA
ncbi:MAG: BACON domain-containing protein [Bacteroidales bacterium]